MPYYNYEDKYKTKKDKDIKVKNGRIIECVIDGCEKKPYAEGLCMEHYDSIRKLRLMYK